MALHGFAKAVHRVWSAIQLKRFGSYSPRRLLALQHFSDRNTLSFSIFVVCISPIPCLTLTTILDAVSVDAPELGVVKNNVFILRAAATFFLMIYCLLRQMSTHVGPSLKISACQLLIVSTIMAVVNAAAVIPLGLIIGFPVPFTLQITAPIEWVMMLIMVAAWTSQASIRAILSAVKLTMLQFTAVFVYPFYYYVYTSVPESNVMLRTVLWCLLPILRLANRQLFHYLSCRAEGTGDLIPLIISLNADVASALFITFCVQFSPTLGVALVILVFKAAQATRSYLDLRTVANEIENLRGRSRGTHSARRIVPVTSMTVVSKGINQRKSMLEEVARLIANGKYSVRKINLRSTKVETWPSKINMVPSKSTISTVSNSSQQEYNEKFRRLLYMTESVLLTEYVDVIIPALYGALCCSFA